MTDERQNKDTDRSDQIINQFLMTITHELKTPLNTIIGMSQALEQQAFGSLNEKQIKSISSIEACGVHLLTLVNNMLDISRIGAGLVEPEINTISVESFCSALISSIQKQASKKNINILFSLDDKLDKLQTDQYRLNQILVNLLDNAIKFTPENKEVGLKVTPAQDKQNICFTIWDQGIGIATEDILALFRPFRQLDSQLNRKYSGIGMGLALAARITEMLGGKIEVESELTKGSRFTVFIPCR